MNIKNIFKKWRVVLLLIFLFIAVFSIRPQITDQGGVSIRSVIQNSAAANAGMTNPNPHLTPVAKEKIIGLNGVKIQTLEDYSNIIEKIKPNQTLRIQTTKKLYRILVPEDNDIGLRVSKAPTSNLRKGLDLEGGTRVLLEPQEQVSQDDLEIIIQNLQERLNVYGLSDVIVRESTDLSGNKFILVEMAGVTEEEIKELLSKQGKFEAKINNQTVFSGGKNDITYVCRSAQCSGIDPRAGCSKSAEGYSCRFFFSITLTNEAAEKQSLLTRDLKVVDDYLSDDIVLFLDDQEVDRLKIGKELQGRPTTQIQISGSGSGRTMQEASTNTLQNMKRLQTIILTGSLPVKLDIAKMDTISPSLGSEFLRNMLFVGLLAILAVITVIYFRYRTLKVVIPMVLTLISEVILIVGFAAFVGWNLDLAAIAGILIVVGTGVDHLIVITDETIKGEGTKWKTKLKQAMFIVFGAYLTTVAGMLPLWFAGAGLLKGFAFTTIAGISFGVLIVRPAYASVIEELF